jgi:hypothetical protein
MRRDSISTPRCADIGFLGKFFDKQRSDTMPYRVLCSVSLCLALAGNVFAAEAGREHAAILAVVQEFFDTMASKDVDGARAIVDPEGSFVSVRWQDGERVVRRSSLADYLDSLENAQRTVLERMWEPQVLIRGPIAIVWTAYDFHRNGELSHCGVDAFQLVKGDTGWIINGGTYTVEQTGCGESPLGPPR